MPRLKSNAPRRLDESQQGPVGDRSLLVPNTPDPNIEDEMQEYEEEEEEAEDEESYYDYPYSPSQEADEVDFDLLPQAPEEYFDLRRSTEIEDLEVRQIERERNELNRLKARLGDDLEGSADLQALKAQQSRRRELELEDLENQRNLDLDLRTSQKFIRVPYNILQLLYGYGSSNTQRSPEDPTLGVISMHHASKREWCLRSVSSEMLIQLANNKSKYNPVYIETNGGGLVEKSTEYLTSVSYQVRLKRNVCSQIGHVSDDFRFPRDFARAMNNLFYKSIHNVDLLPENYIQTNIANTNVDANELFEFLKIHHSANTIPNLPSDIDPQHKSLIPKLRAYQADAVKWMITKETSEYVSTNSLHPLYEEVTADDGSILYLNKYQGNILMEKPIAAPPPRGGILADEMGLGKTVEVLALILTNVRPSVSKPDWKKPECVEKPSDTKKRRLRKREKSPVEFHIREEENVDVKLEDESGEPPKPLRRKISKLPKAVAAQKVKSDSSDGSSSSSDEDYEPSTSASMQRKRRKVSFKCDGSTRTLFNDSSSPNAKVGPSFRRKTASKSKSLAESDSSSNSSSDEDYKPTTSKRNSKKTRNETYDIKEQDGASKYVSRRKNSSISNAQAIEPPATEIMQSAKKAQVPNDPIKTLAAKIVKEFKPNTILNDIKKKATLTSYILGAIAETNDMVPVSGSHIKTYVFKQNHAITNKAILKEMRNLLEMKKILNATGTGVSGSFVIHPLATTKETDSRGLICKENLDAFGVSMEKVITDCCYDGVPPSDHDDCLRLEVERIICRPKMPRKRSSTFEALKKIYDEEMELQMRRERRRRAWGGTFFDTKVEQCQYIECICGTEAEIEEDPLHRIQCIKCGVWQHSACVKFDIEDPYRGDYLCPHCWMNAEPVESCASLIISPSAIVHQWIEEIQKHIKHTNINVLFYKGTKSEGYIQPRKLASYDIVITTYTTLQSEVHYVDLPHTNDSTGRRFRNPKRFLATPTALPCVNWWRVCLDEAQMIENPTSKTAEMALRLKAINRWCVSGTPMGKSLDDLYGLFVFLNVDPYNVYEWWNLVLTESYNLGKTEPLKELLAKYMWRTSKIDVENQINIPLQSEEVHWLRFSPVEEHFYRRIYYDASNEMKRKLSSYDDDLSLEKIDRKTVKVILGPLLRLRQSCSHPQAVRGQFNSKIVKFTMGDLMTNLISKAKLECEDQNRIIICCLNGLAGLHLIRENFLRAADKYREVLRFIDENKSRVKTDDLQRLHTLTNLSEILKMSSAEIPKTLRDESLDEEAAAIRSQYLLKCTTSFSTSEDALKSSTDLVKECQESFLCNSSTNAAKDEGAWYIQVMRAAATQSEEDTLLDFIREEMIEFYSAVSVREINAVRDRYTSLNKIKSKLYSKIDELDNIRDSIINEIVNFHGDSLDRFVQRAVECHLRKSVAVLKNKEKCELCNLNDQIAIYENTLFHFVKGDLKIYHGNSRQAISVQETERLEKAGVFLHSRQRQGTWGDSEAERLLRALLKYSKQIDDKLSPEVLEDAKTHLKMYAALKKEFKAISVHCRLLFDQVAAYDELSMCTLRLRLRYPWEPKPKAFVKKSLATMKDDKMENINVLEIYHVGAQEIMLGNDLESAKTEFHKKLSQLEYLHNLEKHSVSNGGNKENCPVCLSQFGSQWAVLECYHLLCVTCLTQLTQNREVKCPICRGYSNKSKISFVDIERKYKSTLDREAYEGLKGNLPTKLSAIVCQLKKIDILEPGAKSLVFSSWVDVLKALGDALTENEIKFVSLHERSSFVSSVRKFKENPSVKVMLIPFQTGASGLNLTIATHVFLTEPILHPGQEQQAIGRIHRIGQTKPTVVHKFVVKNTIEEKIFRLTSVVRPGFHKVSPNSNECDMVTIKDLRLLFDDGDSESQAQGEERFDMGDAEDDAIAIYVNT